MELETFTLQTYTDFKAIHKEVLVRLWNDPISREYVYDLSLEVDSIFDRHIHDERNQSYIVFIEEEAIGYISIMGTKNNFHITYALLPEYRGKGIASELLKQFTSKVFEKYDSIDELSLIINKKNIASQHVASNSGYKKENVIKYTKKRNDN